MTDPVIGQYTGAMIDVKERHPERNNQVALQISEPLLKNPKEEQIECDIRRGSEEQWRQGETDISFTLDCVKNDPEEEEDSKMPSITESYNVKVVKFSPKSSATLSADLANDDEHKDRFSLASDAVLSRSEGRDPQKCQEKKVSLFRYPRIP